MINLSVGSGLSQPVPYLQSLLFGALFLENNPKWVLAAWREPATFALQSPTVGFGRYWGFQTPATSAQTVHIII